MWGAFFLILAWPVGVTFAQKHAKTPKVHLSGRPAPKKTRTSTSKPQARIVIPKKMQYHIEGACRDTKLDKVSFMGSLYRIFGVRKGGVQTDGWAPQLAHKGGIAPNRVRFSDLDNPRMIFANFSCSERAFIIRRWIWCLASPWDRFFVSNLGFLGFLGPKIAKMGQKWAIFSP